MTGAIVAIGLVLTPQTALAADCGAPAKEAVYQTVTTPAVPPVVIEVEIVDSEAVPAVPAVYEDVKVVDVEAKPGVPGSPAVYEDRRVIDVEAQPATPGTPAVEEVSHTEVVIDKPAWTEVVTEAVPGQHYSLKGNSGIGKDEVPAFPADYWQANTEQEPHDNGAGNPVTWVGTEGSGLHYASHGSEGLRDWFYYRAPVDEVVIEHPAETHTVKVIDVEAKPAVPGTPAVEEVSHIEHVLVTPEVPAIPAVEEVSHIEHRLVTPAVPAKEEVSHIETFELVPGVPASSKKVLVSAAVPAGEACPPASPVPAQLAFTGSNAAVGGTVGAGILALGVLALAGAARLRKQD